MHSESVFRHASSSRSAEDTCSFASTNICVSFNYFFAGYCSVDDMKAALGDYTRSVLNFQCAPGQQVSRVHWPDISEPCSKQLHLVPAVFIKFEVPKQVQFANTRGSRSTGDIARNQIQLRILLAIPGLWLPLLDINMSCTTVPDD